jgi:hypothetical protein
LEGTSVKRKNACRVFGVRHGNLSATHAVWSPDAGKVTDRRLIIGAFRTLRRV